MKSTKRVAGLIGVSMLVVVSCVVAIAADLSSPTKPAAVDPEQYVAFMEGEALDAADLAEGAEIQRRFFNHITPPGISWLQPMSPPVVPFAAANFADSFLDDLLGEEKNSVAVYPLSLALDPKTRETLVYNADGKLIATLPAEKTSRVWPEDADPARVTLLLDLLPSEDVEPYLYTESRIEKSGAAKSAKPPKTGGFAMRSLGAGQFGVADIQQLTNGNMRVTVTNGEEVVETFAYTVWHTASVVVVTYTNEESNVVTDTNTVWTPVSPPLNGLGSAWECQTTNLVLTNGVGVWEDANISSNARIRFYSIARWMESDGDKLTDGSEKFVYHTDPYSLDTDEDGLLDGYDIVVGIGDARYGTWTNYGIIYIGNDGFRTFKGELSAGSNPLNGDTDGDTLPDGWEVQNGLDPSDDGTTNSVNGASGDRDGDGFDNRLEYDLGAPANNPAWNGEELAYRLTHAHAVIVTNARSITTNLIGMRVDIERSLDCGGSNSTTQNVADVLAVPALLDCGYYVDITVEGSVEAVDTNYDMVFFEAFTNTFYFMGHDDIGQPESCVMVDEGAMRNNLIFENSTVNLRYDTVGYKWHSNAYAQITEATNALPYQVVVAGDDAICVGETTTMGASGGAGSNYTWNASGHISVNSNGNVTGISYGPGTVMAADHNGCTGEKQVVVLKADIGSVSPLADRTLHPDAARHSLLLKQTLPSVWNGQMELILSNAVAYSTLTGGVPITSAVFTNSVLSQTIYLEGDGCGVGDASFSIVGPPGCGTNIPLQVFGVNATLAGVAETAEECPGGFIADRTVHTNAPRTGLVLAAGGPSGSSGDLVLTWDSAVVHIYTAPTGGTALAQYSQPFTGFNGTNLYVEGIAPGSNVLAWSYSEQSDCEDDILVTVLKVDLDIDGVPEADEETVGKVVVRRTDGNNASRKKIVLCQAEPSGWSGNLILTQNGARVKVYDVENGGVEITFNGTDNKFSNGALPKDFWVQGDQASDSMRDVSLDLSPEGLTTCKDTVNFSVLWVSEVTGQTSGNVLPTIHNAARPTIVSGYFEELGVWKKGNDRYGLGIELKGAVKPSDFNQNVKLDRDGAYNYYKDMTNGSTLWTNRTFGGVIPPGNDTGPDSFRDDDPQSGDSDGQVYDWDAPGIAFWSEPTGTVVRARSNMKEFAVYRDDGADIRCSLVYQWNCVRSGKKTGPNNDEWSMESSVANDNKVVFGSHENISWNLQ